MLQLTTNDKNDMHDANSSAKQNIDVQIDPPAKWTTLLPSSDQSSLNKNQPSKPHQLSYMCKQLEDMRHAQSLPSLSTMLCTA